jgi:hypothetical protein
MQHKLQESLYSQGPSIQHMRVEVDICQIGYREAQDLVWKLAYNGHAQQIARIIEHFHIERASKGVTSELREWQFTTESIAVELVRSVAQQGRTDILEHLHNRQLLVRNDLLKAVHNGAIEGDQVAAIKWLQAHDLLQADFKKQLHSSARDIFTAAIKIRQMCFMIMYSSDESDSEDSEAEFEKWYQQRYK